MDAISILDEVSGDLGLVLWRSARNVLLWAETPVEGRAALFAGEAARARGNELSHIEVHPELRGPLSVIADLLAHPGEADLLRLVNACRRLSLWAEQHGSLATALEFAQAAALAAPDSSSLAYAVGRLARRRAEYDRAESWYTRAAVQGRHTGDWRSYALAFSGIGNLHMQRGNYPAARRSQLRSLRAAERKGLIDLVGNAYHGLFSVEIEARAGFEADALAAHAFRAYGPSNPKVLRLAYDVAYHWVVLGDFAGAASVATVLLPHFRDPAERTALLSLIGRAAGGRGDRAGFEAALDEARVLLLRSSTEEVAAISLLGFAHGALSLGAAALAGELAQKSLAIATRRSEGRVLLEAESVAAAAAAAVTVGENRCPVRRESNPLADALVEAVSGVPVAA